MNFTREPIIETVITPREGCKLVVRNSKGGAQEDYFVDAIEVVSFGHSFFFRSLERPKSFLVPMSDYEILEIKETRMVLKNVSNERSIKIGGGRDTPPPRAPQQQPPREMEEPSQPRSDATAEPLAGAGPQLDRGDNKKRDRRRSRRRRGPGGPMEPRQDMPGEPRSEQPQHAQQQTPATPGVERDEEIAPSFISKLFPPPPTLIKETLGRYKNTEDGLVIEEKVSFKEETIEKQDEEDEPVVEPEIPEGDDETKFED